MLLKALFGCSEFACYNERLCRLIGDNMISHGVLQWGFWGDFVALLVMTHVTIVGVTVFLHRHQAHRALDLAPLTSHFFRFWLWLTTGMVTKEWVAIHRKHHAKCETAEDPHSPQVLGINKVLWGGVLLYVKESKNAETMEKYSRGTPDDWIERNVYQKYSALGVTIMAIIDMILFGPIPGICVFVGQMVWIPFWAAGVINGIGHFWGYRHFNCRDASTNIVPWGVIIGGEELHNNHHAFATSAKLSQRWYEFDIGWMYIRLLETVGQAHVKHVAPKVRFDLAKKTCDEMTLQAVIRHRYDVMRRYSEQLSQACRSEIKQLQRETQQCFLMSAVGKWLREDNLLMTVDEQHHLQKVMNLSPVLRTIVTMKNELVEIWTKTNVTKSQLLNQLQDWCLRAENSGIQSLNQFAKTLKAYTF